MSNAARSYQLEYITFGLAREKRVDRVVTEQNESCMPPLIAFGSVQEL
jgi:hypothetical protein